MRTIRLLLVLLIVACATTSPQIETVKAFRTARERGNDAEMLKYLAPDARMWWGQREGAGSPLGTNERWHHWDVFFHGHSELYDWKVDGNVVTAMGRETNDFYRLTKWTPPPFRNTWWLDDQGRITAILFEPLGKSTSRFDEVKAWAKEHHPGELAYLMPKGEIDPTADRPERWKTLLEEWRRSTAAR
ncbi:MAG TPA: hypothetical protein VII75_05485 [Thermoanaerobaculia bacterium]